MGRFTKTIFTDRKPEQWEIDLNEFIGSHAHRPRFGFRASCLEHWAYQYLDEDMALTDSAYPSQIRRKLILDGQGFDSKIIYLKDEKESGRVYCRGDGFTDSDLFVYLEGGWVPESRLKEVDEEFILLSGRREAAERHARRRRDARKRERVIKEREEAATETARYAEAEAQAYDSVRVALNHRPSASHKFGARVLIQENRINKKIEAAMSRWRRHYRKTGESMSGEEALLPTRQERKGRMIERPTTTPPIYQFKQTPHPAPAMRDPDPYEAPSVLYQAPSVLSYGDEDDAPSYYSNYSYPNVYNNEDDYPVESTPHIMTVAMARDPRALYEQDRLESLRLAGRSVAPKIETQGSWCAPLGDWLKRVEAELWAIEGELPIFCMAASSLRLAVDTWFGAKEISPKKLSSFMHEQGFEAANKMWRFNKAIRVYYKNCRSAAEPQRMLVCNLNDNESGVTWGMERGAVLREQF